MSEEHQLSPIINPQTDLQSLPDNLSQLCSLAQIDTLGLRNGIVQQLFNQYREATMNGDTRSSLAALKLMLDACDNLDKKIKAISPDEDPAALILQMDAYKDFKSIILEVGAENPEFNLMGKITQKLLQKQEVVDV